MNLIVFTGSHHMQRWPHHYPHPPRQNHAHPQTQLKIMQSSVFVSDMVLLYPLKARIYWTNNCFSVYSTVFDLQTDFCSHVSKTYHISSHGEWEITHLRFIPLLTMQHKYQQVMMSTESLASFTQAYQMYSAVEKQFICLREYNFLIKRNYVHCNNGKEESAFSELTTN